MKKLLTLTALLVVLSAPAFAADPSSATATPATAPTAAVAPTTAAPTVATATPLNSQQEKMKACSQQYRAQNIAKSQHQAFMSSCLKGTNQVAATPTGKPTVSAVATGTTAAAAQPVTATSGKTAQQAKMAKCSSSAKTQSLTGDDRKKFMKSCLSASAS